MYDEKWSKLPCLAIKNCRVKGANSAVFDL